MGTHTIEQVQAIRDAVDRLHWRVRVATDFYGTRPERMFALHWDGHAVFYREAVPAGSIPPPTFPRLTLAARWTNRDSTARLYSPGEVHLEFATDLPTEALDRIEEFRASGRLFVRIEGNLTLVHGGETAGDREWIGGLAALLGDNRRAPSADIRTEPLELTRDLWCTEILATLRPPGRHIIEVALPAAVASDQRGENALAHLTEAQRAFDEGRFAEAARVAYRALDALQALLDSVAARYGEYGQARVRDEVKALKSLCNPERHGEQEQHGVLAFDRALALHVLVAAKNLAGLVLTA